MGRALKGKARREKKMATKAERAKMNTSRIFADRFTAMTTGRGGIFRVNKLTLDAVKIVLGGIQIDFNTEGADEDFDNGFLRRQVRSGFYGGYDGYIPTAKGFRRILAELS